MSYDGLNRVVETQDARLGVTTQGYDEVGDRTVVVDGMLNRTTYTYDELHRVIDEKDPRGNSATYAYDAASRVTGTTDRLGRRTVFAYDGEGRKLTETWYTAGMFLVQTQTMSYDAVGNLLTAQDLDGSYTMTYDALDRTTRVDAPFGAVLTFAYDAVGNRTKAQDNSGGLQTSTYDAANRLTSRQQTGNGATLRAEFTYQADDLLLNETRYKSLTVSNANRVGDTTYTYDSAGRVSQIVHRRGSSTLTPFTTLAYSYDLADRLLTEKIGTGATRTQTYDQLNQLTADTSATYTYDLTGNKTNSGYATGLANETTTDGVWTYTYDAAGMRTQKSKVSPVETWNYSYDHDGHLTYVEKRNSPGAIVASVDYSYDAFGNRIIRVPNSGSTERYGFDGWKTDLDAFNQPASFVGQENWDVWSDFNSSNTLTMRRVYGNHIDDVMARTTSGGTGAWYVADRQGSVRGLTANTAGTNLGTIAYDSFGRPTSESGTTDRYKYTGREYDATTAATVGTGLVHERDRVLGLDLGRFLTRDRLGFDAGDANLTRYVGNGWPNRTDPSGKLLYAWDWEMFLDLRKYFSGEETEHGIAKLYGPWDGPKLSVFLLTPQNMTGENTIAVAADPDLVEAAMKFAKQKKDKWHTDVLDAMILGNDMFSRVVSWQRSSDGILDEANGERWKLDVEPISPRQADRRDLSRTNEASQSLHKAVRDKEFHYNYYANYGWVDWHHALSDEASPILRQLLDKEQRTFNADQRFLLHRSSFSSGAQLGPSGVLSDQLNEISPAADGFCWIHVKATMGTPRERVVRHYAVRADLAQQKFAEIGLGIWMHLSREFEDFQDSAEKVLRRNTSSYSVEDLPSNIIAFYRALYAAKNSTALPDRDESVRLFGLETSLTNSETKLLFAMVGNGPSELRGYKNRSFEPVDFHWWVRNLFIHHKKNFAKSIAVPQVLRSVKAESPGTSWFYVGRSPGGSIGDYVTIPIKGILDRLK